MTAAQVPVATAHAVDERDEQKCVRCGVWIEGNGSRHHRQRRQVGGHTLANLILLCGSGTTGCHGWAHGHPAEAILAGYIVPTWVKDVAKVPLLVHTPAGEAHGFQSWMVLDLAGHREHLPTIDAMHRLELLPNLTAAAIAEAVASLRLVGGAYDLVADAVEFQNAGV